MKYRVHLLDDHMEIFTGFGEESSVAYKGSINLQYFLQEYEDAVNNTKVAHCASHLSKKQLIEELSTHNLVLDDDDVIRELSRELPREYQVLLWQNDLNKQGFLTKIEDGRIIIIDKI